MSRTSFGLADTDRTPKTPNAHFFACAYAIHPYPILAFELLYSPTMLCLRQVRAQCRICLRHWKGDVRAKGMSCATMLFDQYPKNVRAQCSQRGCACALLVDFVMVPICYALFLSSKGDVRGCACALLVGFCSVDYQ